MNIKNETKPNKIEILTPTNNKEKNAKKKNGKQWHQNNTIL